MHTASTSDVVSVLSPVRFLAVLGAVAVLFGAGCRDDAPPAPDDGAPAVAAPVPPQGTGAPEMDADEIGLPVYPGLQQAGRADGGVEVQGVEALPSVVGHTDDAMDAVVAFYAERLGDWNRLEAHGMHVFWHGDPADGFDPASLDAMTRPSVSIMPPIREGMPVRVQYVYRR